MFRYRQILYKRTVRINILAKYSALQQEKEERSEYSKLSSNAGDMSLESSAYGESALDKAMGTAELNISSYMNRTGYTQTYTKVIYLPF
jgi:NRPS condensation-like uncharacterized protein